MILRSSFIFMLHIGSIGNALSGDLTPEEIRELDKRVPPEGMRELFTKDMHNEIKEGVATLDREFFLRMISNDDIVRYKAEVVFDTIVKRIFGFRLGKGWPSEEDRAQWQEYKVKLPQYHWNDDPAKRARDADGLIERFNSGSLMPNQ